MEERVRKAALQLSEDTRLFIGSKIERINYIPTPLEFYRDFLSQSKPVVLTQLASDWAALNKWDLAYLKLKIGAKPVSIAITPDGLADAVVDDAFQLPEEVKMPFDQFVTKLEQRLEHEIYYLQKQNNCLREEYEDLSEDCPGEIDFVSKALNSQPDAINLWVGESRSMSSLHRDPYENIYTAIKGQKRFLLYPPTDRVHMTYKRVEVVRLKQNETSKEWSRLPGYLIKLSTKVSNY